MTKPYFRQVPNFEYVSRNSGEEYISEYTTVKNLFKRGKLREDIFGNLQFFEKYSIVGDERPDNVAAKFYNDSTLDWIVLLSNNILNIQTEWPMTQRTFDEVMLEKYGSYDNLYNGVHHYETEEIANSQGIVILPAGVELKPTWKTNGNFIEVASNKIARINSSNTGITTVTLQDGIFGLVEGTQVYISNVTPGTYNGAFIVTSTPQSTQFTFNLPTPSATLNPIMGGSELAFFTIPFEKSNNYGNSAHYYEYYDSGLGQSVQVPSTSFIKEVTNYEYELKMEEEKRDIYILKPSYLNVIFNDLDDIMPYKKGSQQYVTENLKRGDNIRLYS